MFKVCVVFLLLIATVKGNEGIFDKIKAGFKLASKFLGVDKASDVADLVSEAFKKQKRGDHTGTNENIFSGFLRLLGFDNKKIGAIAVNALIFIAQLISSSLSRPLPPKLTEQRDGTPLDWVLNNTVVSSMFDDINNPDLPENVINYIKSRSMDEETDCIQLLICKGAPFIWSMQNVVNGTIKTKNPLNYFPEHDQIAKHADECEKKHPFCFVNEPY